ncbi:DUF551 domain-containing protein [Brevundimonas sp. Root1423]|uniref:DUF551 domain-containing protein n=1 Tax=Brevundimonas sp. Root1423 TaxID=1736462 RepID=UPI0006FDC4B3|nr:DUF551 domain-containing protein [Brevundimonas sp. Root1423]KQY96411.1 hypothetical protein ASD25_00535 [Brevundimonas sp. Root1423]
MSDVFSASAQEADTDREADAAVVVQQHFVLFLSPGTFVAEATEKPVPSWDVATAVAMADSITERHGATPYGFRFITRGRAADELDSRQIAGNHSLGAGALAEALMPFLASHQALVSPAEQVGWRDIATAPRDGTTILVANVCNGAIYDVHWQDEGGNGAGWVDGTTDSYEDLIVYEPSHWMPLPTPPADRGIG